jgi:hypothetical protein
VIEEEVNKMMNLGVIEPSTSPYSSPVVLVKKKDGSVCFCWWLVQPLLSHFFSADGLAATPFSSCPEEVQEMMHRVLDYNHNYTRINKKQ